MSSSNKNENFGHAVDGDGMSSGSISNFIVCRTVVPKREGEE